MLSAGVSSSFIQSIGSVQMLKNESPGRNAGIVQPGIVVWSLAECGVTANGMDPEIILAIHMVVVCIEILCVRQGTFVIFFGDNDEVELGVFSNETLIA